MTRNTDAFTSREEWFWTVIDAADRSRARMIPILQGMSRDELIAFHNAFSRATHALFRSEYVSQIQDDGTEDNVVDTLGWVVSQGRSYYEMIRDVPSKMPTKFVDHSAQDTFTALASCVYLHRFGDLIPEPDWSS